MSEQTKKPLTASEELEKIPVVRTIQMRNHVLVIRSHSLDDAARAMYGYIWRAMQMESGREKLLDTGPAPSEPGSEQ